MKENDENPTKQALADDDLEQANGGVWRNFADIQMRWRCSQCGEYSSWYMLQTEGDLMEAAKTAHTKLTGHTCFEEYHKR